MPPQVPASRHAADALTPALNRRTPAWLARASALLFAAALLIAVLVLATWGLGRWELGTLGMGGLPMAPSAALLMSGLALAGLRPEARQQSVVTGLLLILVGSFAVSSNLSWLESEVVRRFTDGPITVDSMPIGVMSPVTAAAFILSGVALITSRSRPSASRPATSSRCRSCGAASSACPPQRTRHSSVPASA